jgi:hypothetical protein
MMHVGHTALRMLLRLCLALIALTLRLIYAYYEGIDMLQPGHMQKRYWAWTCVICVLVYAIALPASRTERNHPGQRATDKRR